MSKAATKSLLAILLFVASGSLALGQAGSTGGTIGKTDKSISGGETPRAVAPPKAKAQETSSGRCNRIVGTWSWHLGVTNSVFRKDGSAAHPASGSTGKWTCAGNEVNVVWSYDGTMRTDHITVAQDGNSILVVSPWGGGITFTGKRQGD